MLWTRSTKKDTKTNKGSDGVRCALLTPPTNNFSEGHMAQHNTKAEYSQLGDGFLIKLQGNINESLQLTIPGDGPLIFDLDNVHRITSFGVKTWLSALQAIQKNEYFFVNCRPAMVSQFNMISNFAVRGQMATAYAPYCCPKCGKNDIEHLFDLREEHQDIWSGELPEVTCPKCGAIAEFDDLIEIYFEYARTQMAPKHPLLALYLNKK
jgi:predicted nucleic-acid-binding Zn-ribbon protein